MSVPQPLFLTDVHWPLWTMLIAFAFVVVAWVVGRAFSLPLALLLVWAGVNGTFTTELTSRISDGSGGPGMAFMAFSGSTMLAIVAVVVIVLCDRAIPSRQLSELIVWWGALHSIFMIGDQTIWSDEPIGGTVGLLGNRSIGSSYSAVWTFIALRHRQAFWLCPLGLIAVVITPSSMGFLGLVAGVAGTMIPFLKPKAWLSVALLALVALVALGPLVDHDMFKAATRYDVWMEALRFQTGGGIIQTVIGVGLGSFKVFAHPIVVGIIPPGRTWIWLHNDWLQIMFELGVIGLGLAVWSYMQFLALSITRPWLFASFLSFGAAMIGNYPLHMAAFALTGAWMAREAIRE